MKIDVTQLRGKWPQRTADWAIEQMVEVARGRGWDVYHPRDVFGSAMITRARNLSLQRIRPDSDYVLFVDDDMAPAPGALTRLISHNKPVVSALCTTRSFPPQIAAKAYDKENDQGAVIAHLDHDILIDGPWLPGFAFLLLKTSIVNEVKEFVLSGQDWISMNRRELDRLHVRGDQREKERQRIEEVRRALYERENYVPVFQMPLHDGGQYDVAEDVYFSLLLHQMGVKVWLDTGCYVGHIGEFPYSPMQLGMKSVNEVQF